MSSQVLVVYYSRSVNTRRVAHDLTEALECRREGLRDPTDRSGLKGTVRSGLDGLLGRVTPIAPVQHDPGDYELVVVGTPVWGRSVSAPVRAYLAEQCGRFREIAFFVTHSGIGADRTLAQLSDLALMRPAAHLSVGERELDSGEYVLKLRAFVRTLRTSLRRDALFDSGRVSAYL